MLVLLASLAFAEPVADPAPVVADEVPAATADAADGSGTPEAAPPTAERLALEQRLLGPVEEPAPSEPAPQATVVPALPPLSSLWPIGIGVLGVGLFFLWRKKGGSLDVLGRLRPAHAEPDLRIVARSTLAGQTGLALVEVRDQTGAWRRLLVGTGGGPPQLVADLGEPSLPDEAEELSAEALLGLIQPRRPAPPAPAPEPPAARYEPSAPVASPTGDWRTGSYARQAAPSPLGGQDGAGAAFEAELDRRLDDSDVADLRRRSDAARNLLEDVLARRDRGEPR